MMKSTGLIWIMILAVTLFSSCKDKKIELLSKKWDCVNVENLLPAGQPFQSAQDSANAIQLQNLVGSLSWTFNDELGYECAVSGRVVVRGTYELKEDGKILVCTPSTKNNINLYIINVLTENDLVLRNSTNSPPLVMHFKPF